MRSVIRVTVALFVALAPLAAQEASPQEAPAAPAAPTVPAAPQEAPLPPLSAQPAAPAAPVAPRPDALLAFNQGRAHESAGRAAEAAAKFREAIAICDAELAENPQRMDAYTVKSWSLFRLGRYREVVDLGTQALRVRFDARIVQVMGEAYFHLGDDAASLRNLQRYIDSASEFADRVPTSYFYMAESYVRLRRFDHADIAYALAVYREPNMPRWWLRYGLAVEALGDYRRADEYFGRALRLSPTLAEARDGQARVRARLN